MEPLFVSAINESALVAGGIFMAGMAALADATFQMGYPSEVKNQ